MGFENVATVTGNAHDRIHRRIPAGSIATLPVFPLMDGGAGFGAATGGGGCQYAVGATCGSSAFLSQYDHAPADP